MNNIQISNILRIQEASKQDKLVIFVGAGVSTNSGVPMWSKLIESLKDDLPESLKRETDDLKIAQLYKDSRGYKEYIEKIKETLMYGRISPNAIHYAILDLNPCHIITTNYDDLIEQAVTQKYQQYYVVKKDSDLPYLQYQNTIIKMHGDYETDNIVLTENDYYNYPNNFPLIRSFVQSLFASKLILFVGFSFNDMNLKIILNDVSNILKENMQRVYFLTCKDVDPIQRTYYENKGINIVSLPIEDVDNCLEEQSLEIPKHDLTLNPGIALFKQLYLIKKFCKEKDLLNYVCGYFDSYKDEIKVLGEGLKYIIPKNEQLEWDYHSSGLWIFSPFVEKIQEQLKTFSGRRKFIIQYNDRILYIRKLAYVNRIFKLDNFTLINKRFYRNIRKYFTCTSVDYFYSQDYINLCDRMKEIRTGNYRCHISDLELPFILYKLGDFYQAYLIYKDLSALTWKNKKYILYFICMYNIYSIRYGIRRQLESREDIDSWSIVEEIEKIDLPLILRKLPIDTAIKHVFEDLMSYRFHGSKLVESVKLKEEIANQRKSAEHGGSSRNSHIYLLESKFYQEFDFCNDNYIVCDNNSYVNNIYYNVVAGILNSHVTKSNTDGVLWTQTKIEKLRKEHLLLMIFHINNQDLLKIIKQYDIKQILLSDDALEYLHIIIKNIEKAITQSKHTNYIVVNSFILRNIVENIISISNKAQNDKVYIEQIYVVLNYIYGSQSISSTFALELKTLIDRNKPDIENTKILIEYLIFRNYRYRDAVDAIYKLSIILNNNNQVVKKINNLEDIPDLNDVFLCASIYKALNGDMQEKLLNYLKKNIKELYYLLLLNEEYDIPVIDKTTLKRLLEKPCFDSNLYGDTEEISCSILARLRKNDKCNSLFELIDAFAKNNVCLQFYMNPIKWDKIDLIKPNWINYCDDDTVKVLLDNRIIREKVKEYIANDDYGRLFYNRIWSLM